MNRKITLILIAALSSIAVLLPCCAYASSGTDSKFPLRWEYPEEHFISTQQFYKMYPGAIVIDARTKLEWEALRVKGAFLDSVDHVNSQMQFTFDQNLREILRKNPQHKSVVFYCNGIQCPKSYQATFKAIKMGVKNVYEYDSGILVWANAHPELTTLFGHSPMPRDGLIPHKEFLAHTLAPKSFDMLLKAQPCHCFILDIRDFVTRDVSLFPGREHYVSLDDEKRFDHFLDLAKREHRTLFIYDKVGKEAPFVQYYLKQHNIQNYWFLRGGEAAWIDQSN
ncbi:MAG: rhodanese-like domain-containing protein [Acidiferrobacterales bacterium]